MRVQTPPVSLFAKPVPGTPKGAAILLIAIMIPSGVVTATAGQSAGFAFGIAAGFVMAVAPFANNRGAAGSAVIAAAIAAAATVGHEDALAIALLMLVSAALMAVVNQRSAGLMGLAPIIVILFGPGPIDLTWWQAALWVLAGSVVGLLAARMMHFEAPLRPVSSAIAWHHAVVLGVLSAAAMYWSLANDVSHGYWVAVTVVVALRPLPEERRDTLQGRLLGTLGGAVIALIAALVLPTWAAAMVAIICLFLLATYAMGGSYFMQTLFLTPMLLLFASLGDEGKGITLTAERVTFTVIGAALVVVAALLLRRWDGGAVESEPQPS